MYDSFLLYALLLLVAASIVFLHGFHLIKRNASRGGAASFVWAGVLIVLSFVINLVRIFLNQN